jgi:hypothetical protein
VSEDVWIEPRTVATLALAGRRSNLSARSHLILLLAFKLSQCKPKYNVKIVMDDFEIMLPDMKKISEVL